MEKYNFEGDLSNVSERQLEFINETVLQQSFKVHKVIFEVVGEAGDNYSSHVKRIKITGEKTMSMIIKIAHTIEAMRKTMNTAVMFKNEHTMYTEVLPKMLEMQKKACVPENEQINFAKCYGSLTEEPYETIILEDLKESGYVMEDRFGSLSDACVKEVLRNFAIYHSLSFVLKKKDRQVFNYFKDNLTDIWGKMDESPDIKYIFTKANEDAISVLNDPKYTDVVNDKLSTITSAAAKLAKLEYDNEYSIIHQGDSWTNNIMFKYPDDKTVKSIMIDYQMANNSSVAYDIMYMIFNCTNHKIRSEKFYEWLEHYYSAFDKSLSYFGIEAKDVFPRKQLDIELKKYGELMCGISMLLAGSLIRKNEEAAKMKESFENSTDNNEEGLIDMAEKLKIGNTDEDTITRYIIRMKGLIDSFLLFNLL